MKNKNLLPLLVSLACVGTLAACNGGGTPSSSSSEPSGDPSSSGTSEAQPDGATGIFSLLNASAAEKTDILGALEKYAVNNMITGMPLFENGGYVMYNPRVVKGTENYITGYGFGILREGKLTAELTNPEVVKPTYYNTADTSDPGKINALDDQGAQVADLYDYIAGAYFGTKMNAKKDGYDWYGVLSSKDRPWIVKDGVASEATDPEEASTTWRVFVRTGEAGGIQFRSGSKVESRKAYDGRYVTLDDYLTAFKVLLCKKFNYYRGSELAKQSGYSAIAGAKDYWDATSGGINDEAFAKVGVKGGHDETHGDYLDFTLGAPASRFYAMYALANSLYAPINLDFFNLVTDNGASPKAYGGYNSDKSMTPVDNILGTSSYYLESWEEEKGIAFARNDNWYERKANSNLYQIPGVYINIWTAGKTDSNYLFNQFLDGKTDVSGIPLSFIAQYQNDDRTTTTKGTSVFKLNVNSCDQETWNKLFGDNGTVARLGDNSYEVKPWMSNENFIKGMFFSINRTEYGAKRGRTPSTNYFSSNYMSDPENGISYNATQQHADAVADFWGDTLETGGYSLALSQAAFNKAIDELLEAGAVADNGKLTIESWWMEQSDIQDFAGDIEEYIEKAFNESSKAQEHHLTLDVVNKAGDVWSDVYDKHLQIGKFDLGFGSISGNSLDPLNFMEVLKSDNSSGFTLNWGKDTSAIDLDYKGQKWSFNSLWAAADHGVVTYKGVEVPAGELKDTSVSYDPETGLTVEYSYKNGKALMADKAATGDVDAKVIADLSDEDYSTVIKDTYCSFKAGYATIDTDADGFYVDAMNYDSDTAEPIDLQALDDFDDEGNPLYVTYYEDGAVIMDYDDPWVVTENVVKYDANDNVETASVKLTLVNKALAATLAATGYVQIVVEVAQNIEGVESSVALAVSLPINVPNAD